MTVTVTMIHEYDTNGQFYVKPNPDAYTGKALIALTESPTYNLISWATKTYEQEGNINRMISTGFHDEKEWFSVLFQIMAGLYTLQNHEIAFRNFKIQDCIYIKDLRQFGNSNSHWRYKIDGIDYYVPNYGYLVLIDTNYREIEQSDATLLAKDSKFKHRIESTIFGQYSKSTKLSDICGYNCFKAFVDVRSNESDDKDCESEFVLKRN